MTDERKTKSLAGWLATGHCNCKRESRLSTSAGQMSIRLLHAPGPGLRNLYTTVNDSKRSANGTYPTVCHRNTWHRITVVFLRIVHESIQSFTIVNDISNTSFRIVNDISNTSFRIVNDISNTSFRIVNDVYVKVQIGIWSDLESARTKSRF
jgi:hypothetical protein